MAFSNIFLDETVVICYDAVATVIAEDHVACAGVRNALSVGIISIAYFPGICKYFFFGRSEAQDGRRKEDKKKEVTLERMTSDVGHDLSFRPVARRVLSAPQSLTTVFGMGTGGPSA